MEEMERGSGEGNRGWRVKEREEEEEEGEVGERVGREKERKSNGMEERKRRGR